MFAVLPIDPNIAWGNLSEVGPTRGFTRRGTPAHGGENDFIARGEPQSVSNVLVVDNDETYLRAFTRWMRRPDRAVWAASTLSDAIDLASRERLDVAIIDFFLDRIVGTEVIRAFREAHPELPLVLITSNLTPAIEEAARGSGVDLAFDKCDYRQILPAVEAGCVQPTRDTDPPPLTLAQNEWNYVTRVFVDSNYNKSETARRLAISRITLHRKLGNIPPKLAR